jgi:WD40 repeat protein
MAQHKARAPTLSMKFSRMELPGLPDRPELDGNPQEAHTAYLPAPEVEQPQRRAPVPVAARKTQWNAEYQLEHRKVGHTSEIQPKKSLIKVYKGHMSPITCVEFGTIDNREFLFTGSVDTTARMYNVATSGCLHIFEGHTASVTAITLCHIAGVSQETVESRPIHQTLNPEWGDPKRDRWVFDCEHTYKTINVKMFDFDELGHHDYMGQVEIRLRTDILKNGTEIAAVDVNKWYSITQGGKPVGKGKIKLKTSWSDAKQQLTVFLLQAKDLPAMDGALHFSDPYVIITVKDEILPRFFTAGADKVAKMWSIDTGQVVQNFVGHSRPINALTVKKCLHQTVLLSASLDKTIRMWSVDKGSCLTVIEHPAPVMCLRLEVIPDRGVKRNVREELVIKPGQLLVHADLEFDVLNNTKLLSVIIRQGKDLPAMDLTGKSDPFVVVSVGHHSHKSRIIYQNLNPVWNERYLFDDFDFEQDIIVRIYDWDLLGAPEYMGHVAISLENLKLARKSHTWHYIDYDPYSQVRLFTGCLDKTLRMINLRTNRVLKTYKGHTGSVTAVHLTYVLGKMHMFSCALDKTVKMWELDFFDDEYEKPALPSGSWDFPAPINDFEPVVMEEHLRFFVGCEDSKIYMRTMITSEITSTSGWRRQLAIFLDSIPFSFFTLSLIVLDISIGLYYDESINPDPSIKDCFGREPLPAAIITCLVLWIFSQEVFGQVLLQRQHFFVPLGWGKAWAYLDVLIVAISVGVSAFKVAFDYQQAIINEKGAYIPPPLLAKSEEGFLYCTVSEQSSNKETQKAATGFRAARVLGRIALAIRIVRALVKAARIAQKLGGNRGKKFVGHDKSVTALKIVPPVSKMFSLWQIVGSLCAHGEDAELAALSQWRASYENKWRFVSSSSDCVVIMWDIMGTEIRVDPRITMHDEEVKSLPIAELAV